MGPYVILDLETTGLDPYQDAIIQVAMRHSDGREWSSFVNPERSVDTAVRQLTGFQSVDFTTFPPFRQMKEAIVQFIDNTTIVGHNVRFDLSFLKRQGVWIENQVDTLEWSRLAFPLRPYFSLVDFFPHEAQAMHDARVDTRLTEELLRRIHHRLGQFSRSLQQDLARLLGPEWSWWEVAEGPARDISPLYRPGPDLYQAEPLKPQALGGSPVEWIGPGGPIAKELLEFQERPGQTAMAAMVAEGIGNHDILLAEAGTGTGKSLAYLAPVIFQALEHGERVVVATHTVALQEQLWQKDLGQAAHGLHVKSALVKGRGRYLCLYKASEVMQQNGVLAESRERRLTVANLLTYLEETQAGDADDFPLKNDLGRALWSEVVADSHACAGSRCPYAGPCYMRKARHQAESSHVVVVNHALLAAHMANGNSLPAFSHVVIDEAHHFGEVVEKTFGYDLDVEDWQRGFRDIMHARLGLWHRLPVHPELLDAVKVVRLGYQRIGEGLMKLSQDLVALTPAGEYDRRSVRVTAERQEELTRAGVMDHLAELTGLVQNLVDQAELLWQEAESRGSGGDNPAWLRYRAWQQDLVKMAMGVSAWSKNAEERVSWWEMRSGRNREPVVSLRWAYVDIAPLVDETLWSRVDSATLTSATLSIRGRFDYLSETLGVPAERLKSLTVPSPFNWRHQARLLIPSDAPDPSDPAYFRALADFIISVARARQGRTLVLLTSYRAVEGVAWRIRDTLKAYDIKTLAQGLDGQARRLVNEFRLNPQAVLIGALTYWEGVDIPGADLEVVIMGRLPFRAPGDPLEEARQERIRAQGQSPFYRRSIPDAVIRFQQGFGRLIRTTRDRGVVVVFDPRIHPQRTRYGQAFLDALRDVPRVISHQEDLLDTIQKFWGNPDAPITQQ